MKYITKENIKIAVGIIQAAALVAIAVELLTLEVGVSQADKTWEINADGQMDVRQSGLYWTIQKY